MIHIAICDDDPRLTEQMESLLIEIQKTLPEEIEVSIYYSGETFTNAIQSHCPYDIILMDIEMSGMDGIKAGCVVRENDENDLVQLIYISSHEKYYLQLFDVQPSGFIKKPISPEIFTYKLKSSIHKVLRKREQGKRNFIPIRQKGKEVLVPFRDIIYIESSIRRILIYSREETFEYYGTLNEEEKKLPDRHFIRIHQSYIVNLYSIKEITHRKVVLVNSQELPISEKKSALVRRGYLNYRGNLYG